MNGNASHFPALIIFLITYLIIVIQKIPRLHLSRAAGALVGAVAMGMFGVLTVPEIYAAIDLNTITFLLGMMILISYLEVAGFFALVERLVLSRARSGTSLLALVVTSSGLLSSIFMNDTICLVFTPVILRIAVRLRVTPVPYLLAMVTAANIGSVMTLVGNPQNMLIGVRSKIPFLDFLGALWPVALAGLLVDFAMIWWLYRRSLQWRAVQPASAEPLIVARVPLALSLLVMAVFLILLMAGYPPQAAAMSMGAVAIVLGSNRPVRLLQRVDWTLLVLFAGLFVVMHGVEQAGVIERILRFVGDSFSSQGRAGLGAITVVTVIVSNLISNVPAVLLLSPMLVAATPSSQAWLTLAMSASLAGNLTVIGSAANLIVFEMAKRAGVTISVVDYLKIGVPITLLTLAIGAWLLF